MSRHAIAILSSAFLLFVPAIAAGLPRATPAKCAASNARVLAADSQAQVLQEHLHAGRPATVVGCARHNRRAYALGVVGKPGSGNQEQAAVKALTGYVVAVEHFEPNVRDQLIVVTDLRDGRTLRKARTGGPPDWPNCLQCVGDAVKVVLKIDGSLAWITEDGRSAATTRREIHAVDRTGNRVLASGLEIDVKSLVLNGSTLHWTQHGQAMSATLQ